MSEILPPVTSGTRKNHQGLVIAVIMSVLLLALVGVWGYYLLQRNLLPSQPVRLPEQTQFISPGPSAAPSGNPEGVKRLVNSWCGDGIFGANYVYDPLQKTLQFTATGGQEITVELLESKPQIEAFKELPAISQIEVRTVVLSELSSVSDAPRICVLPEEGQGMQDQPRLFKAEEVKHVYLY